MLKRFKGFTIVELLIVIVVIGILATITIVAYNNVTTRADNARRMANLKGWSSLIQTYRAMNGQDFSPTETWTNGDDWGGYYCLGLDFPDSNRCWSPWNSNSTNESASLMAALKSAGTLPAQYYEDNNLPDGFGYGPIVYYESDGTGTPISIEFISEWFHGTTCPAGTQYHWSSASYNVATCRIYLSND